MLFRKTTPEESSTSPAPAKRSSGGIPSLISTDLRIKGDVVSSGELHIEGVVEGEVLSHNITIGELGEIRGKVIGSDVVVCGRVIGTIQAKKVSLKSTAHVTGDLDHESLAIDAGAHIEGNCHHVKDISMPAKLEAHVSGSSGGRSPAVSNGADKADKKPSTTGSASPASTG